MEAATRTPFFEGALRLMSTPRGLLYSVFCLLFVLHWIFGLWFIKIVAIVFLAKTLLQNYMEGFSCLRCMLGLFAAVAITATVFGLLPTRMYLLAFIMMWLDAFSHAT